MGSPAMVDMVVLRNDGVVIRRMIGEDIPDGLKVERGFVGGRGVVRMHGF